MSAVKLRPQAFRLEQAARLEAEGDAPSVKINNGAFAIEPLPDFTEAEAAEAPEVGAGEAAVEVAQSRGILRDRLLSWGGLFVSAAAGFILLVLGNWIVGLVGDLFARSRVLGIAGLVLAALAGAALLVLVFRELFGIIRQSRIAQLHIAFAEARAADDGDAARRHIDKLTALYARRPQISALIRPPNRLAILGISSDFTIRFIGWS